MNSYLLQSFFGKNYVILDYQFLALTQNKYFIPFSVVIFFLYTPLIFDNVFSR